MNNKLIEAKLDWIAFLLSHMFTKKEMIEMFNEYQKEEKWDPVPNLDKEQL